MRFIFFILLIALFGYSMALVLFNTAPTPVDLLFAQIPIMNLGILLVVTLVLGVLVGLLLGVIVFRVFQTRWEIKRLNKELEVVRARHIQAAAAAAAATASVATPIQAPIHRDDVTIIPPMM